MKNNVFKYLAIAIIALILVILIFYDDVLKIYDEIKSFNSTEYSTYELIKVEIRGAVIKPGVYNVYNNCYLNDVIEIAILDNDADITNINLTKRLKDGDYIYIPYKNIESSTINSNFISIIPSSSNIQENNKININKATLEELQTLNGIGPSKAKKIIDYIAAGKKITSYEELVKIVGGLKDSELEQIKENTVLE